MSRTDINTTTQPPAVQTWRHQVIVYTHVGFPAPQDVTKTSILTVPAISSIYRKGNVNPQYWKLLSTGDLPPNVFSFQRRNWTPLTGIRKTTVHNVGVAVYDTVDTYSGVLSSTQFCGYYRGAPSALILSNLQNQSLAKARLRLKDQDVNLLEVWGERHESLNMIRENVNRIGKTYASLKRGDFRGAAAALGLKSGFSGFTSKWRKNQSKAIANGWLELQYGWRPLLMDIHGAVEALHKSFVPSPKNQLIRVSAVSRLSDETSETRSVTAGSELWRRGYEVQVKTCLYFRQTNRALHTLASLGITNPAYLVWELTRYSFVVDWLVHIGDFLSSLDASIGYEYRWGCVTIGQKIYENRIRTVNGQTSTGVVSVENSEEADEYFSVNRNGLATEIETIPLPAFKDPLSVQHTLNAIALLRQSFRK